ncbi:MAG: hypothetical protein ABEI98_04030 [Halorhabdus sp.]
MVDDNTRPGGDRQPSRTAQSQQRQPGHGENSSGDTGGSWLPGGLQWTPLTVLFALVLVGGAAAGVFVATGGEVPLLGSGRSTTLDAVPEGVDMVMYADSGILDDQTTATMVNGMLALSAQTPSYAGPTSYSELTAEIRNETDIGLDRFESATVFATYPEGAATSPAYVGVIVNSEWSTSDLVQTIEENGQPLQTRTYRGTTVYVRTASSQPDTWLAPLGDGTFVMGTETAVTDAIDVNAGDMDAFSGPLKESFTALRDGYVKFVTTMPRQATQQAGRFAVAGQVTQHVERVAGVYYASGRDVGITLTVTGPDQSGAESIKEGIEAGLSLASMGAQDASISNLLDAVKVSQNGRDVTVTFEYAASDLVSVAEQFSNRSTLAA